MSLNLKQNRGTRFAFTFRFAKQLKAISCADDGWLGFLVLLHPKTILFASPFLELPMRLVFDFDFAISGIVQTSDAVLHAGEMFQMS